MWLNDNLIKFLESSGEISKTTIFISDLKKIRLITVPTKPAKKIDKLVSRELLETLLIIGTGFEQDRYLITNSKNSSIPLLENDNEETTYVSQIILPIWVDNELKGSVTLASNKRLLDDYDLELAKSIQIFIEESIINSINEEFLKKSEKKKVKTILKKDTTDLNELNSNENMKNSTPLDSPNFLEENSEFSEEFEL